MIYSLALNFKTESRSVHLHVELGAQSPDNGRRFVVQHVLMPAVLRVVELCFNRQPTDWKKGDYP